MRSPFKQRVVHESSSSTKSTLSNTHNSYKKEDLETAVVPFQSSKEQTDPTEISWDSPSDPANPLNWSTTFRWTLISLMILEISLICPTAVMFAPNIPAMMHNSTMATLLITIWALGTSVGPLGFAPLSEVYGRLVVRHTHNIGAIIALITSAQVTSASAAVIMMFVNGVFAGAVVTNGGSVIADIVRQEKRGFAIAILMLGLFFPVMWGPIVGTFVGASLGWRWIFRILAIAVRLLQFCIDKDYCLLLLSSSLSRHSFPSSFRVNHIHLLSLRARPHVCVLKREMQNSIPYTKPMLALQLCSNVPSFAQSNYSPFLRLSYLCLYMLGSGTPTFGSLSRQSLQHSPQFMGSHTRR